MAVSTQLKIWASYGIRSGHPVRSVNGDELLIVVKYVNGWRICEEVDDIVSRVLSVEICA
jgi:hypothetical protein